MIDKSKNKIRRAGALFGIMFLLAVLFAPIVPSFEVDNPWATVAVVEAEGAFETALKSTPFTAALVQGLGAVGEKTADAMGQWLGNTVLNIASLITLAGGKTLEIAIRELVLGFGAHINGDLGDTIGNVWTLVRDISNLVFVFGFLFIGIKLILNADSGAAKKMLAQLIIAALLINFSLFITKVVIEFSNVTAYTIYNAMTDNQEFGEESITAEIVNILGITTWYEAPDPEQLAGIADGSAFWFYFSAAIFLIIAGYVFFVGALMLIVRFVGLLFIMMLSPILFAATIFPQTEGYAKDLWKKLINYSLFAPAYLLLIIIGILVLKKSPWRSEDSSFVDEFTAHVGETQFTGSWGIVLNFIVAIAVLLAATNLAKKFGLWGGEMVVKMGHAARKSTQGFIGRNTAGRISNRALKWYEKASATASDEGASAAERRRARFSTGVASAAFLGKRNLKQTLESGKKAKFGGSTSYEDVDKFGKDEKARIGKAHTASRIQRMIDAKVFGPEFERELRNATLPTLEKLGAKVLNQVEVISNLTETQMKSVLGSDKFSESEKQEFLKIRRNAFIAKLSTPGTTDLKDIRKATQSELETIGIDALRSNGKLLVELSSAQLESLSKSKEVSPQSARELAEAREKALEQAFVNDQNAFINSFVKQRSDADVATLPRNILVHKALAPHYSGRILHEILHKEILNSADRDLVRAEINQAGKSKAKDYLNTPEGAQF